MFKFADIYIKKISTIKMVFTVMFTYIGTPSFFLQNLCTIFRNNCYSL